MDEGQPILSVNELQVTFPGPPSFTAVKNLSFTIGRGKTLAVVGESGSGKSLTALALMGLLPKTASLCGKLLFYPTPPMFENAGTELTTYDLRLNNSQRGCGIGMVFQEPMSALNPVMQIGSQVTEAILAHQNVSKKKGIELAIEWLRKVHLPEPEKMYYRYPHQLSGGQKQRVMIAMAMCNNPSLLIADEPTTALDATVQQEIIRLMEYLQQEHNTAMLFITHDLALAASIADEVLVMYKGELVEYGPVDEILKHPSQPYTKALLSCRPSPSQKGKSLQTVADFMNVENEDMVNLKSAPVQEIEAKTEGFETNSPLLDVKELNIWFPVHNNFWGKTTEWFKAVNNISFFINKGEILGLAGESGCGKSTLSRALVGLLPVQSGTLNYHGRNLAEISIHEWRKARKEIQLIFQDPYSSLNPRMTISDTLAEPLFVHNIVPFKDIKKEVLRLLNMVQLPATAIGRYAHEFSGGQRQRIGIARALAVRPQLLICDECVSALDVSIQAQILNLLRSLQQELQLTYLFISHDLNVVQYISDRVMIMQAGKIVETGDAVQVLQRPQNEYTKKLIGAIVG